MSRDTLAEDEGPAAAEGQSARPADDEEPLVVGRYELRAALGRGGMGTVHRAYDRELEQEVALKFLLPREGARGDAGRRDALAGDDAAAARALDRFRREAQLLRLVAHRNVLRVFEFGEAGKDRRGPFLVTELVDGESLEAHLQRAGALPGDEVLRLVDQLLAGLEAAHARGIVHRDIKPQNLVLERGGRLVLVDFGIARRKDRRGVTQRGALVGTPEYMPPEQLAGLPVDERADLYAVGAVAQRLLGGERGSEGEARAGAGVPGPLGALIASCLALDPELRPATAAMARAILAGKAEPPDRFRSHFRRAGIAAVVIALAASLSVAAVLARPAPILVAAVAPGAGLPLALHATAPSAALDLLARLLVARAPRGSERSRKLHAEVGERDGQWVVTADGREGVGPTLLDAATALVAALGPAPPGADTSASRVLRARTLFLDERLDEAGAILDELSGAGGPPFEALLLQALSVPPGGALAQKLARELTSTAATPREQALAVAISAHAVRGNVAPAVRALAAIEASAAGDPLVVLLAARLLVSAGRTDDAMATFERQTRSHPRDARAWLELTRLHRRAYDLEAARRTLERYRELRPGSSAGQLERAQLLLLDGRLAEARSALAWGARLAPDGLHGDGARVLVACALRQGDRTTALEAARSGLAVAPRSSIGRAQPSRADAMARLAVLAVAAGELERARAHLGEAATLAEPLAPARAAVLSWRGLELDALTRRREDVASALRHAGALARRGANPTLAVVTNALAAARAQGPAAAHALLASEAGELTTSVGAKAVRAAGTLVTGVLALEATEGAPCQAPSEAGTTDDPAALPGALVALAVAACSGGRADLARLVPLLEGPAALQWPHSLARTALRVARRAEKEGAFALARRAYRRVTDVTGTGVTDVTGTDVTGTVAGGEARALREQAAAALVRLQ